MGFKDIKPRHNNEKWYIKGYLREEELHILELHWITTLFLSTPQIALSYENSRKSAVMQSVDQRSSHAPFFVAFTKIQIVFRLLP